MSLRFAFTLGIACGLASCTRDGAPSLSKNGLASDADDGGTYGAAAADSATWLTATSSNVKVFERPSRSSAAVGVLEFGGALPRSAELARRTDGCTAGYYAVHPRGFVCADDEVSLDAPPAKKPDVTAKALPYRFGRLTHAGPVYARIPTPEEQADNEPDLKRHLDRARAAKSKPLRLSANDVPLRDGAIPDGLPTLTRASEGVTASLERTTKSYFDGMDAPFITTKARAEASPVAAVLKKDSHIAIVATTTVEGPLGPRRFGVTPDQNLIAIDRLDPVLGSTFHGVDLTEKKSLPVAFALRGGIAPYALSKGKATRLDDEEYERRTPFVLSGRFRTVGGVRFEETEEGGWLRERDLIKIVKRTKFPEFVGGDTRWIDVSIALQTLTLYEGKKPVYATLISSGKDMLGDPEASASTPLGTFPIVEKAVVAPLSPREITNFDAPFVPYSMKLADEVSLHATTWSDPTGEARNHHDITLTPVDAHRVFVWARGAVPQGFRAYVPSAEEATLVVIRK